MIKNFIIILIEANKASDNVQHPFQVKILNNLTEKH